MPPEPPPATSFADGWDEYVVQHQSTSQAWPGDDWGDEQLWDAWFERLLLAHGAKDWQKAIEIGPGTGKYTSRTLEAGTRELLGCDVSSKFLALCRTRQQRFKDSGRLHLAKLDERQVDSVQAAADKIGWRGKVDAVFSIDTLVHLPFSRTVAYLIAARELLRPGGIFACTFADGTTEHGHGKLLDDLERVIHGLDSPRTGCFHWLSPDLMTSTATRLGFEIVLCDTDPVHHRDGHFVARWPG